MPEPAVQMDRFITVKDQLSETINEKSCELFNLLRQVPIDEIGIPERCLLYFKGSHYKRLFFSIETSAKILYESIQLTGKPVYEIVLMDYGAGVGTLYTLAKMIGCRKVIYNDFLEDWQLSAKLIGRAIRVEVDLYVVGDIQETLEVLAQNQVTCDIITTRNVVEHIYRLEKFYELIHTYQPSTIVYSSTTANIKNPLTYLQHYLMHRKWEKSYLQTRKEIISKKGSGLDLQTVNKVAFATRGMDEIDILSAFTKFINSGTLPDPSVHRSNTCEPMTGVWVEHLLTFSEYRALISEKNYQISFRPGFWDTHYASKWKNYIGWFLNPVIRLYKGIGFVFAPFIYVIAVPKRD